MSPSVALVLISVARFGCVALAGACAILVGHPWLGLFLVLLAFLA